MALKLIGAGFGRTGTLSTYAALNRLGFPCYHMREIFLRAENKDHLKFWRKVAISPPGSRHDWNRIFSNYAAALDNPSCCVWQELANEYPNAKILLTLHPRGAEAWYDSTVETIYFTETLWQFQVLKWLTPSGRRFGDVAKKLFWGRSLKGVMGDKAKAVTRYNTYIEEVKSLVPPDRLLIFSVTDGWGPLCRFLEVPEPSEPFPNLNDRESGKRAISNVYKASYITLAAYSAAVSVAFLTIWWILKIAG